MIFFKNKLPTIAVGQWLVSGLRWSSSARQNLTAQQNGPSIEGPEGPRPTAIITITITITSTV